MNQYEFEKALQKAILNLQLTENIKIEESQTFFDACVPTLNSGLVLTLSDDSEMYITIQKRR